jgi:hypothetical protein
VREEKKRGERKNIKSKSSATSRGALLLSWVLLLLSWVLLLLLLLSWVLLLLLLLPPKQKTCGKEGAPSFQKRAGWVGGGAAAAHAQGAARRGPPSSLTHSSELCSAAPKPIAPRGAGKGTCARAELLGGARSCAAAAAGDDGCTSIGCCCCCCCRGRRRAGDDDADAEEEDATNASACSCCCCWCGCCAAVMAQKSALSGRAVSKAPTAAGLLGCVVEGGVLRQRLARVCGRRRGEGRALSLVSCPCPTLSLPLLTLLLLLPWRPSVSGRKGAGSGLSVCALGAAAREGERERGAKSEFVGEVVLCARKRGPDADAGLQDGWLRMRRNLVCVGVFLICCCCCARREGARGRRLMWESSLNQHDPSRATPPPIPHPPPKRSTTPAQSKGDRLGFLTRFTRLSRSHPTSDAGGDLGSLRSPPLPPDSLVSLLASPNPPCRKKTLRKTRKKIIQQPKAPLSLSLSL